MSEQSTQARTRWSWLWKTVPYLMALTAAVAILHEYPPRRIAVEMGRGNIVAAAPFAVLLLAASVFIVALSDYLIVAASVRPLPYLRLARAQAVAAMLTMVGYGAAVGGFGVWIARVSGSGPRLATGIALFRISADLIAVSLLASASIWLGGAQVAAAVATAAPIIAGVLLLLLVAGPARFAAEARVPPVFLPWRRISRSHALAAVALRVGNILWITVCCWAAANAFGMAVPLAIMTTYFPVVLVIGSLPVNVGGFGAVQGAWLLLAPWADSAEQVLAFAVLWQLAIALVMAIRGLPFLRAVTREAQYGVNASPAPSNETSR